MNIPEELLRLVNKNRYILFVGAGISIEDNEKKGLPSGSELAATLAVEGDICSECELIENCDKKKCNNDLADVAQYFKDNISEVEYINIIRRELKKVKQPLNTHRLIAQLKPRTIITTNYDDLLEKALEEYDIDYIPILKDSDIPLGDQEQIQLIKIHGCIRINEFIITRNDYFDFWDKYPSIIDALKNKLISCPIIYIGYSLNDNHFQELCYGTRKKLDRMHPSYAVVKHVDRLKMKFWENNNINFIKSDAESFLRHLLKNMKNHETEHPKENHISNLDIFYNENILCRDEDIENIEKKISRMNMGCLVVYGNPGVGKTTIMSYIAKKNNYTRIAIHDNYTSSANFILRSIINQLEEKYKFGYNGFNENYLKVNFIDYLYKIANVTSKEIIFIDWLDYSSDLKDLIPSPPPPKILFVVSVENKNFISGDDKFEVVPLKKDQVPFFMQPLELNKDQVDKIFRITEGYPFYLDMLKNYLLESSSTGLDTIPEGIHQFMDKLWRDIDEVDRDFLTMLANFEEPINIETLSEVLNYPIRETEKKLQDNARFVRYFSNNEVQIYHNLLKKFIKDNLNNKQRKELHLNIVNKLISTSINDNYLLRHISSHLLLADHIDALCAINNTKINNYRLEQINDYEILRRDLYQFVDLMAAKENKFEMLNKLMQVTIRESISKNKITKQYIIYLSIIGEYKLSIDNINRLIVREERVKCLLDVIKILIDNKGDLEYVPELVQAILKELDNMSEEETFKYVIELLNATCKDNNYFGDLRKLFNLNLKASNYIKIMISLNEINDQLCKELAEQYFEEKNANTYIVSYIMIFKSITDDYFNMVYHKADTTFNKVDLLVIYFITQHEIGNNLHEWCLQELKRLLHENNFPSLFLGALIDNRLFHAIKHKTTSKLQYSNLIAELSALCPHYFKYKIKGKIIGHTNVERYINQHIENIENNIDNKAEQIDLLLNMLESANKIDVFYVSSSIKNKLINLTDEGIALSDEWLKDVLTILLEYDIHAVEEILNSWIYRWQLPSLFKYILEFLIYQSEQDWSNEKVQIFLEKLTNYLHRLEPDFELYEKLCKTLINKNMSNYAIFNNILNKINSNSMKAIIYANLTESNELNEYKALYYYMESKRYISYVTSKKKKLETVFEMIKIYKYNNYLSEYSKELESFVNKNKDYNFGYEQLSNFIIEVCNVYPNIIHKLKDTILKIIRSVDDFYDQNYLIIKLSIAYKAESMADAVKLVNQIEIMNLKCIARDKSDLYQLLAIFYLDLEFNKCVEYIELIGGELERSKFVSSILNKLCNRTKLNITDAHLRLDYIVKLMEFLEDEQAITDFMQMMNNNYMHDEFRGYKGEKLLSECENILLGKIKYYGYRCLFYINLAKFYNAINNNNKYEEMMYNAMNIYNNNIKNTSDRVVCCCAFSDLHHSIKNSKNVKQWIDKGFEEAKKVPQLREQMQRIIEIYDESIRAECKSTNDIYKYLKNNLIINYLSIYNDNDKIINYLKLTKKWSNEVYEKEAKKFNTKDVTPDLILYHMLTDEDNAAKAFDNYYRKINDYELKYKAYISILDIMTETKIKLPLNKALEILGESKIYDYNVSVKSVKSYLINQAVNSHNELFRYFNDIYKELTYAHSKANETDYQMVLNYILYYMQGESVYDLLAASENKSVLTDYINNKNILVYDKYCIENWLFYLDKQNCEAVVVTSKIALEQFIRSNKVLKNKNIKVAYVEEKYYEDDRYVITNDSVIKLGHPILCEFIENELFELVDKNHADNIRKRLYKKNVSQIRL